MARSKAEPPTSYVSRHRDGSTTYVGALATKLYQAMCVRACLASPVGAFSNRKLLTVAQAITGRRYGAEDRHRALHDLDDWITTYELLVPVLEDK